MAALRKTTWSTTMTISRQCGTIVAVFVLVGAAGISAAEKDEDKTFLTAKDGGFDYAAQGEYLGVFGGDQRWGAQVIALGGGKFRLIGYEGGLPGDGWSRGGKTNTIDGERDGNEVKFKGNDTAAVIRDGAIHITHEGEEVGAMKKTERKSPTLGAKAPDNAVVLFDGSTADQFEGGKITEKKLLAANCETKLKFGDHSLHLEFRTPFKPYARGQGRGNSGVYIHSRYECQVLDSFGLEGKNNECGGIYSISEPAVNMCLPPLTWQTYDMDFTAPKYKDGEKVKNGRVTIKHNGVVIHDDIELPNHTPGKINEGPEDAGIYLQGHGNPVVYRNIWVVNK
jgi:hypothetical protein